MARIAAETEDSIRSKGFQDPPHSPQPTSAEILADAAHHAARESGARAIVVFTSRGSSARLVSRYRPPVAIFAITPHDTTARQLSVSYGVIPLLAPDVSSTDEMLGQMDRVLVEGGYLQKGELVVFVAGQPVGRPGTTNLMKLHRIGDRIAWWNELFPHGWIAAICCGRAKTTGGALVVALHGFSSNPEEMLRLTLTNGGPAPRDRGDRRAIRFFVGARPTANGYGWVTNRAHAESIRLHHEMVLHVLEEAGRGMQHSRGTADTARFLPARVAQLSLRGGAPGFRPRRGRHLWRAARRLGRRSIPAASARPSSTSPAARTNSTRPNARNNTHPVYVFVVMMWSSICSMARTVFLRGADPSGTHG